jgi:alpha-glucosidase (family GH31 glycosyl hydrolase)
MMGNSLLIVAFAACCVVASAGRPDTVAAQAIRYAGADAELSVYRVSDRTIEVRLAPIDGSGEAEEPAPSGILVDYAREALWRGRTLEAPVRRHVGDLTLDIEAEPLAVILRRADGSTVQTLSWPGEDGAMQFQTSAPVFGLGQGGPQFDRRGHLHPLRDGWGAYERPTHGSRVVSPVLIGVDGWSLIVHQPINAGNAFDVRAERGVFQAGDSVRGEALSLLLTAWDEPVQALSELALVAGRTPLPPKWTLGYMQSHRTLEGPEQMLRVAQTFRERNLPIDAVIYLGTGFTPLGWNLRNGNYDFHPQSFPEPARTIGDLHALNLKVVLHSYGAPAGLHGTAVDTSTADRAHIANLWERHMPAMEAGADAWWPDGGENLSMSGRLARARMYRAGPLSMRPNVRPWALFRTGYTGVQRYGGWLWSGDVDSYWETLKTQIAVGLNHGVSLSPFWGSDTGGFLPSPELTGELYVRWFQFSAFTPSFRSHGRGWHVRLPWGWNTGVLGPPEVDRFSDAFSSGYPRPEELHNGLVEPITREYLQLRYRLLPYSYTLVRETHDSGLPPMRAMWLHYPDDAEAVARADQFLWGRDLLIAPVYTKAATERSVYLPAGDWYDLWTNERIAGGREITRRIDLATMPVYVRAGSILPLDPVRQYTSESVDEPTTLQIYPGRNGAYRWYQDDGMSLDYERGEFSWTRLLWDDAARTLVIEHDPTRGGRTPPAATLRVRLMAPGATGGLIRTVHFDGTRAEVTFPF